MTLKYYHAEPVANSLKSLIALKEKSLDFESVYVDLQKFEQHEPWFIAINPEGQVPVLEHNGDIITHSTVINEYLEDCFSDVPLRPLDALGKARMRYWNKFIDEELMAHVSLLGWQRLVPAITKGMDEASFEAYLQRIPLPQQRQKWRDARAGFPQEACLAATAKIEFALNTIEARLTKAPWLAGDSYTLADINFFSTCGVSLERTFPHMNVATRAPRIHEWRERVLARPAIQASLTMPNKLREDVKKASGYKN